MIFSLRAVLIAVLAAGLLHIDAHAQMRDGAALPPSATEAVEATPTGIGEPVRGTRRHGELTLETGSDGGIVLYPNGATRREILHRLFAERRVEIEWRNKAFAEERVQGRLSGTPAELARRLLERVSYIMFYEVGDEPQPARLVVLGSDPPSITRGAGAPSTTRQELQASEAARKREAIETARRAITAAQRR